MTELRKFRFQMERAQAQLKVADDRAEYRQAHDDRRQDKPKSQAINIELDRRQITAPFKGEVNEIFRQARRMGRSRRADLHLVRIDKVRVKGMVCCEGRSPEEVDRQAGRNHGA